MVSGAGPRLSSRLETWKSRKIDEKSMNIGDWRPETSHLGLFYGVLGADGGFQACCKSASQGHGEG